MAHLELQRLIQSGTAHVTLDAAENAALDQIDRAWARDAPGYHTYPDHPNPDELELNPAILISTIERRGWTEPAPTPMLDPSSVITDPARIGIMLNDNESQP